MYVRRVDIFKYLTVLLGLIPQSVGYARLGMCRNLDMLAVIGLRD